MSEKTPFLKDILLTYFRVGLFQLLGLNLLCSYPLVLLFLRKQCSWVWGALVILVGLAAFYFGFDRGKGAWISFGYLIFAVLPALAMFFALTRYRNFVKTMLTSVWINFVVLYLAIFWNVASRGQTHDQFLRGILNDFSRVIKEQLQGQTTVLETFSQNWDTVISVAPSLIFVFSSVLVWINLLMIYSDDRIASIERQLVSAGVVVKRISPLYSLLFSLSSKSRVEGCKFSEPTLATIIFPDHLIWVVLGILAVNALGLIHPFAAISRVGLNLLIVASTAYFFQGLSIASHFMHRWKVGSIFRFVLYFLLFLHYVLVVFLGVFDHWFDFRKIRKAPMKQG
jgi:hypothetical protein